MKKIIDYITIEARRDAYKVSDIKHSMTISELIEALKKYNGKTKVYICNDSGFTYGKISSIRINEETEIVDDDEEEEE
jgi:GDP-D-mannose dehydratase